VTGTGRRCLYCGHQIAADEHVALCSRCLTAHHAACWDRNGRCSTFRCPGTPLAMAGADVSFALRSAMVRANAGPGDCATCGQKVYAGALRGRIRRPAVREVVPGLVFEETPSRRRGVGRMLGRVLRAAAWPLPGAEMPARSCVKCHRLYVWGMSADSVELQTADADPERFCPTCGEALAFGRLRLRAHRQLVGVRFHCDTVPCLHAGWFGHQVIDRFLLSHWRVRVGFLPARSCRECGYTEVAGRPIFPAA